MREIIRVKVNRTRGSESVIVTEAETFADQFAIYIADYGTGEAVIGLATRVFDPFDSTSEYSWVEVRIMSAYPFLYSAMSSLSRIRAKIGDEKS